MFHQGDRILYGRTGVCTVEGVCEKTIGKNETHQYYTLRPLFQSHNVIYAPVDSEKIFMRTLLSEGEVRALIERLPVLKEKAIADLDNTDYSAGAETHEPDELVKIAYKIGYRRKEAHRLRKKISFSDEKWLRMVENVLFGEVAAVLGLEIPEVEKRWFS